jgi:hypothetical protein
MLTMMMMKKKKKKAYTSMPIHTTTLFTVFRVTCVTMPLIPFRGSVLRL